MKTPYLILFICIVFASCYSTANNHSPSAMNRQAPFKGEPGKCYAKCLIPDQVKATTENYPIYTGTDTLLNSNIEKQVILLEEKSTKWVKKKADRNCMSSNPDDCLVWCLVESPAVYAEAYVVIDTSSFKEFELKPMTSNSIVSLGGFTEWKEVICDNNISERLISDVQLKLAQEGHYTAPVTSQYDQATKEALKAYQQTHGLPIGSLNLETLDALNVIY